MGEHEEKIEIMRKYLTDMSTGFYCHIGGEVPSKKINNALKTFAQGMDKIYKQFVASLEELGVKAIEAEGNEFDPNFHNAVMHVEDEQYGENVVAEELQKGYMYRDSVVRHSMVKVAN